LNIIEYLFCERLFGQVLLIEKNCSRKSVAGKVRQKNAAVEKSAVEKVRQKNGTAEKSQAEKSATEKSR
jgi:hypothetical protein